MWRQIVNAVAVNGQKAEWLGEWVATDITFRARSQTEAQGKADRFWCDAELGSGSMVCAPIGTDPNVVVQAEGKGE
jgi:hypothetical protein